LNHNFAAVKQQSPATFDFLQFFLSEMSRDIYWFTAGVESVQFPVQKGAVCKMEAL
jgi:hypothetical protein